MMKEIIAKPESKFLKVVCSKCKNEQIIFNKATSLVKCLVCGAELAEPTGGKAKIKAKVLQTY
ncbi:MAG: 30S ribosomal protein S27e [Candidatus Aenigmatarchaeota archaeon]